MLRGKLKFPSAYKARSSWSGSGRAAALHALHGWWRPGFLAFEAIFINVAIHVAMINSM